MEGRMDKERTRKHFDLSVISANDRLKGFCLRLKKAPLNYWELQFINSILVSVNKSNQSFKRAKLTPNQKEKLRQITQKYLGVL